MPGSAGQRRGSPVSVIAPAVEVPEVAAFRAGDGDRIERVLDRPGVEDVFLGVGYDLPAELRVGLDDRHARSLPPTLGQDRGPRDEP